MMVNVKEDDKELPEANLKQSKTTMMPSSEDESSKGKRDRTDDVTDSSASESSGSSDNEDESENGVNITTTEVKIGSDNETSKSYPHSSEEELVDSDARNSDEDGAPESALACGGNRNGTDSDSDEEVFVGKRKRLSKINRSLLDDSDEESGEEKKESTSAIQDEERDSEQSEGEDSSQAVKKSSRIKKMSDSDDENSDEEPSDKPTKETDSKTPTMSSDIFDAKMDGSEKNSDSGSDSSDNESRQDDGEDDGFVAPKAGRWLKGKGAAKQTPKEKQHREKALQAQEIHSETHRMVREAQVRLPYHQPQPLNLKDMLNRRKEKQTACLHLRPTPSLIRQMSLESPSTKRKPPVVMSALDNKKDKENVPDKTKEPGLDQVDGEKEEGQKKTVIDDKDDDPDYLPDLYIESVPIDSKNKDADSQGSEKATDGDRGGSHGNTLTDDSGFVTTPFNSSDDESNGMKKAEDETLVGVELTEGEPMDVLPDITHQGRGDAESSQVKKKSMKNIGDFFQKKDEVDNIENDFDVVDGGSGSAKKVHPKLDLLANLDLPSLNPKLDMGAGDFIDFDMDDEVESQPMTGVQGLMSRFIQHTKKTSPKASKTIEISYVHKDVNESDNKEVLKLGKISYELEAEKSLDPKLQVPGAKLQLLKEKLRGGMKARREEARLKRQEAYEFDNEEGFVDEEKEEEAELTDQTDTDAEDELDEAEEMEEEAEHDKEEEVRPFADDEAEDDEFGEEENMHLELNSSDSEHADDEDDFQDNRSKDFFKKAKQKSQRGDDTSREDDDNSKTPMLGRSESVSSDTQKDTFLIPSSKRKRIPSDISTQDMFTPFSKVSTGSSSSSKGFSATKSSGLSLPIEETQDLYRSDTSESIQTPKDIALFQSDDDSQMLDDNGFMKVNKSASKKYIRRQLHLEDDSSTQNDMRELIGMCSGRFPDNKEKDNEMSQMLGLRDRKQSDQEEDDINELLGLGSGRFPGATQATQKKKMKGLLSNEPSSTQADMDELLGLCSGQFTGKSKLPTDTELGDTQSNMDELMGLCSGKFSGNTQSVKKLPMSTQFGDTQANVDELMGLCSGKFPSDSQSAKKLPLSSQFGDTQSNFDELVGLCSGKFTCNTQSQSAKKLPVSSELDDSQSNLDELMGLCSGKFPSGSQSAKKLPMSSQLGDTQSNVDELMGLCSGKFPNASQSKNKTKLGAFSQFGDTQSNMDELMGLCSGKFMSRNTQKKKTQLSLLSDVDDDSDDGGDLHLQVLSGDEDDDDVVGSKKNLNTLDSDEEVGNDDEGDSDCEDDEETPFTFKGFAKKGKIRKEFMEAEAELSGSEYDSDENLDLDERDDILEVEEGDKDDVGTEEALRDQVGRVHLKSIIDEDKKELRLLQEMYLPDGDLYSDGQGRQRKFRWKNIDDDTQQDMFDNNSDNEQNQDEDAEHESKWRMERFARERWLEEQKANAEQENQEEDSQLMKFGSVVLKKMKGGLAMEKIQPFSQPTEKKSPATPKSLFRMKQRRGSFLTRSKETLAVIAERTKPVSNPVSTVNSRGFVFSAVSPEKKRKNMPIKRSSSMTASQPFSKRPKLERSNTIAGNSIFKLMDH